MTTAREGRLHTRWDDGFGNLHFYQVQRQLGGALQQQITSGTNFEQHNTFGDFRYQGKDETWNTRNNRISRANTRERPLNR